MKCYNYFIDGYYIPNKLDETLTDELLKKIELNDKSSYEQLIVHNIRFVIDIVNKYFYNVQEDKDELVAIGIVGLIKGIKSFDLSKNVKLAIAPVILMLTLFITIPALNSGTVGIMVPVGVVFTIAFSRFLYKRGLL